MPKQTLTWMNLRVRGQIRGGTVDLTAPTGPSVDFCAPVRGSHTQRNPERTDA